LFNLCDKVDGALAWFTILMLRTLHRALGNEGDFSDLDKEFSNSIFFSVADDKIRVETSLLCLAIVGKMITTREDLM
jgi:hypothetical protein